MGFTPVVKGARGRPTLKTSRGKSLGRRCSLETGLENRRVRDKHRAPHPYPEPETSKNTFWQLSAEPPGRRGREGEPSRGRTLDAHPQHNSGRPPHFTGAAQGSCLPGQLVTGRQQPSSEASGRQAGDSALSALRVGSTGAGGPALSSPLSWPRSP